MTPQLPSGEYKSLDVWRGFACVWVVLFHINSELALRRPGGAGAGWFAAFSSFGYLGVQLFFVISGYCIANAFHRAKLRGSSPLTFMKGRLWRIMPPYLASLLLITVAKIGAELTQDPPPVVSALKSGIGFYLSNTTLTQLLFEQKFISRVAWSLCYEVAFYVVVAGALLLPEFRLRGIEYLHALTCLCVASLIVTGSKIPYPFDLWPQFGLGVVVFDVLNRGRRAAFWLSVTGGLIIVYLCTWNIPIGILGKPSRTTFGVSAGFAMALIMLRPVDHIASARLLRPVALVGVISYSLYLMHSLVIAISLELASPSWLSPSTWYCGLVATTVFLSSLFFFVCERPFLSRRRIATANQGEGVPPISPAGVPGVAS